MDLYNERAKWPSSPKKTFPTPLWDLNDIKSEPAIELNELFINRERVVEKPDRNPLLQSSTALDGIGPNAVDGNVPIRGSCLSAARIRHNDDLVSKSLQALCNRMHVGSRSGNAGFGWKFTTH